MKKSKFYSDQARFISVIRDFLKLHFEIKCDYFSNAEMDFFFKPQHADKHLKFTPDKFHDNPDRRFYKRAAS